MSREISSLNLQTAMWKTLILSLDMLLQIGKERKKKDGQQITLDTDKKKRTNKSEFTHLAKWLGENTKNHPRYDLVHFYSPVTQNH